MIRKAGIILCILLGIGCQSTLSGQGYVPTPVQVSTEEVNIDGYIFYAHNVLKGQTLYSISKAYNVSADAIRQANPSLKDGLKAGTTIYIPTGVQRTVVVATISEVTPEQVQDVSQEAAVTPAPKAKNKKYKKHTVKWYENIYDIAQKYKVPVDALIAINSLGEDTVLKKRQVLLIPDKEYITDYNRSRRGELNNTPKGELGVTFPADSSQTDSLAVSDRITQDDTFVYMPAQERSYKISLVLPFNGNNQMDFYAGALIAFRDFKKAHEDSRYTLNVVDMEEYGSISSVIGSGILDGSELIIGPIYQKDLKPLSFWAREQSIPLVSPLDPKASDLVADNPYFFQFPPAQENLILSTYDGVASESQHNGVKPLIIYENWTRHSQLVTKAINATKERGVEIDTLGYGILEGRGIDAEMLQKMDTTRVNTVFVVSENEAFVSDVLRNLLLAKGQNSKIEIDLYGLPKWKNFEIIELSYFHDLNTHISFQYFIDYTDPKTIEFLDDFRYNFKTDPTQYAFQGYDIVTYFISALHEYGTSFPSNVANYEKSLLQSDIRFEKANSGSGFVNNGVRNINYIGGWSIKPWE